MKRLPSKIELHIDDTHKFDLERNDQAVDSAPLYVINGGKFQKAKNIKRVTFLKLFYFVKPLLNPQG